MALITVTLDTEEVEQHFAGLSRAIKKAEETYPDSLAVRRIHQRLANARTALLARFPGDVQTFSGGDKPPPRDDD